MKLTMLYVLSIAFVVHISAQKPPLPGLHLCKYKCAHMITKLITVNMKLFVDKTFNVLVSYVHSIMYGGTEVTCVCFLFISCA